MSERIYQVNGQDMSAREMAAVFERKWERDQQKNRWTKILNK